MNLTLKSVILGLALTAFHAYSANDMTTKSRELKRVNSKIERLQQRLTNASDKQQSLTQELKRLDNKINQLSKRTMKLSSTIKHKQKAVNQLDQQLSNLRTRLDKQNELLANQAQTTYLLGKNQSLQLLLNQQSPAMISRLLTYYRYINEYRSKIINDVLTTKASIEETDLKLGRELTAIKQLKATLDEQQRHLIDNKRYQQQVITTLKHQIDKSQQSLNIYYSDKKRLEKIIARLKRSHRLNQYKRFSTMKHKLPWPTRGKVVADFGSKKTINQLDSNGITILAPEGQKVTAVFPGKVVFADWLRGYGLLIILDHGYGYMTLYAHNQTVIKALGDEVKQGEIISFVGHSGGFRKNSLYFEIRRNGKPINPVRWLV